MRIRDWSSDVCSSENATQYAVSAGALYTISKSDTLDVTLRNGRYSQERVSPDSPTQASRPIRFTLSGGTATYTHVFNRLRVRSEEHTSELQSLMRISYAVFCLKKKTKHTT